MRKKVVLTITEGEEYMILAGGKEYHVKIGKIGDDTVTLQVKRDNQWRSTNGPHSYNGIKNILRGARRVI